MKFITNLIPSLVICLILSSSNGSVAQESNIDKWTKLFDGKSLNGWKTLGGNAPYSIENGVIVGTMTKGTPNSFLVTEEEYEDFILELDIKIEGSETNSGIQTRSHYEPQANNGKGKVYGRQVEIDPTSRSWSGGIYDEARRGWLYPLELNENAKKAFKHEEFNHIRIEAIGDELKTWVNGIPTAYLIDTIDKKGFIGLQVHSVADQHDGKKVYFKDIKIQTKELKSNKFPQDIYIVNLKPNNLSASEKTSGYKLLFNGKDSKGWKSVKSQKFPQKGWEINSGEIKVQKANGAESTNGGDIVTIGQFDVFDLSFEFKLTPGGNSGIKYFVTLDEKTNGSAIGLEYQILDDQKHPDAKMGRNGNRTLASLYDLITSNKKNGAERSIGDWNRGRIVVTKDNKVTHYLNGIKVLSYQRGSTEFDSLVKQSKYKNWINFGKAPKGHILLQDHGDEVTFRSIKIK